jgi:carboxymethylenebutenolidase
MRVTVSLLVSVLLAIRPAAAESPIEKLAVPVDGHALSVTLYPAQGQAKRPAVIIVHGASGIAPFAAAYDRYGTMLAGSGIDAYLLSYHSDADLDAINAGQGCLPDCRYESWAALLAKIVDFALAQKESSGRVGLIGFSRGGYLAVETAALDPRISALAVFYGGIPRGFADRIGRLPPLLVQHGEADTNVPLSEGKALVDKARALGGPVEFVTYPGAEHGFDFAPTGADAEAARSRAVTFLRDRLEAK